ncbi:Pheromone receptor 1 [Penicillium taxi]|uniref:Pheromone receptor 1 n=1 Tax=Penicillium taxi TaxID=168475 RepID=UPI002545B45D|nr:Pheromone receptor 1 [Penicillium taxi]KAJ5908284.1 Pheromone receptor 1 [Penicillium taxi]
METEYLRFPLATVLPVLAILSILVSIPPLFLHSKNHNFPAMSLICWCMVLNLFNIINAFLWPTDDIASWWDGTGLCDIEVKVMAGAYVAVSGAMMCIFRSLAMVLDTRRAMLVPSKSQRLHNRLVEWMFCVIIPCIVMIMHIVYQKSRYYIFSISGCINNYDESWVSLILAWIWPPIICLVAAYYCCLTLFRLHRYWSDFESILRSSSSRMSKSRFVRLFCLAFTMLVGILPTQGYVVYADIKLSMPWHAYSWNNMHGPSWHKVILVPSGGEVFFDRWIPVAMGFIIFIFCGFGKDAMRTYRKVFWQVGLGKCFNVKPPIDSKYSLPSSDGSNPATLAGSTNKAKQFFNKYSSSSPRVYNDLEKGISGPACKTHAVKAPWYYAPVSLFRPKRAICRDRGLLLQSVTSDSGTQTICTSAWAGTSRASSDYSPYSAQGTSQRVDASIHIKQVICQQSEVQI